MPHINLLSPHVADLIAAGEVVERPASVIKELMENAFDAGAGHVTVEICDGGATMIRVIDDGCGMAPEDAGIAFLRHATSKLKDEYGLEAIRTMGFRGEALAAISAVSRIELRTRQPEDAEGTYMLLNAGEIQEMEAVGCPSGTEICVKDLFFNTPARLKFLKSDRSEASACLQAALRCALGRPEISVRFLRDGKEEFFTPGDGRKDACVYALLGREISGSLLPAESRDEGLSVTGFVSSPSAGRGNRSAQFFYCNGRFIRSAQLQAALEQAYRNTLLTGRYPACVLWLEVSPGAVDVNVHPAKVEVKFSEERRVFNLLYQAVLGAVQAENRVSEPEADAAVETRLPAPLQEPAAEHAPQRIPEFPAGTPSAAGAQQSLFSPRQSYQILDRVPSGETAADMPAVSAGEAAREKDGALPAEAVPVEKPVQNVDNFPVPEHKILGEAFKTYIAVELEDRILLIDKHAAHERMNFDRLKENSRPVPAQQLLLPQTVTLPGEEMALLEEFGELFAEFGFELEAFGENSVILRAVPADIRPEDAVPALEEILAHLREGAASDPGSARDELLHTVACKAAIKAGWNTGLQEQERITEEVLSGRVKYCPHGRPVSASVTKRDLDKLFLRIV